MVRSLLLALALFGSTVSLAGEYDISSSAEAKAEFLAVGTRGLKLGGKLTKMTGHMTVDKGMASGEFSVKTKDFKTGIELRDKHLKDNYLEVKQYPDAKFTLNPVKLSSKFVAKGTLELHGTTKEVGWDCQAGSQSGSKKIACIARVNMNDFGIVVPDYMGVQIAKEVTVKVSILL